MKEQVVRKPILSLTKKDFKIETMRGSGPGGQHKNVTDSAVRITHAPSGAVSKSCDQKSQHANKKKAFKALIDKPEFKSWLTIEISRRCGIFDKVEKEVDRLMNEKYIQTEVQKDKNKWVIVDKEELTT